VGPATEGLAHVKTQYQLTHNEVEEACALYVVDAIGRAREVAVDLVVQQKRALLGEDETRVTAVIHILGELEEELPQEKIGFSEKEKKK